MTIYIDRTRDCPYNVGLDTDGQIQTFKKDGYEMSKKSKKKMGGLSPLTSEKAMIEGIIEGSPDAVGVVVVRLDCGCRKMAAVARDGEPASKLIMYRDKAESICDQCKDDNGSFLRVSEAFIDWIKPEPEGLDKSMIEAKVLGSSH